MKRAETITVDGYECLVNHTSALECFMIMHSMRRVLNGGETFPNPKGRMVHVASEPLLPKEVAFIKQMEGSFPPLEIFEEQEGAIVGMTDYEVRSSTTLPGWDGTGRPVILSNPKWNKDGVYEPVAPDYRVSEDGQAMYESHGIEGDDDFFDGEDRAPFVVAEDIPHPAEMAENQDFTWVKDRTARAQVLKECETLQIVLKHFINCRIRPVVTEKRRQAAIDRLGAVGSEWDAPDSWTPKGVIEDFAAMLDDSTGEPAIAEVLARAETFMPIEKHAAECFKAYRYTWLQVESVKTGFGMKCRDLMTGASVFLVDPGMSTRPDVKGMTLCLGIVPFGRYCFPLGMYHPANFEDPSVVLKIVLMHLGLPTVPPITLTAAESACLAAETIKRVRELGRFRW